MSPLKTLGSLFCFMAAGSGALAQAPTGTLPTVTAAIANVTLPAQGVKTIDLSKVFGLPSVVGPVVQFNTVLGIFNTELFPQAAPLTCANFLSYVNTGAYNYTVINRVVPGLVQGGAYTIPPPPSQTIYITSPAPPVANEFNLSNTLGTIGMAKLGNDPNSATDAWFINTVDNSNPLDTENGGFTVFARVIGTGMNVVNAIGALEPTYDLSSILNQDFLNTPLINVVGQIMLSNFVVIPSVAPISIYPTATVPGVLTFSATSSNPSAATVAVSGSSLTVTEGSSGSSTITVTATDSNSNQASTTFTTSLPGPVAPVFTLQPTSQTVASVSGGTTVVLNSAASGSPTPTYQWKLGGVAIAQATSARLVIPGATAANAGTYTCVATNSAGSATSNPATLVFTSTVNVGRLINLSVNTTAGKSQVLTVGFVSGGAGTTGNENLLIRATGPALAGFGVANTLADPTLTVLSGSTVLVANDNWGTPAANQAAVTAADTTTGAFPLNNPASLDAAVAQAFAAGADTAQVSGNTAASGTALAEVYDNTPTASYTLATPRLINLSAKNQIVAGGSMTAGFVVGGSTSKTVLIRATGPALALLGVPGTIPDPQIALHTTLNGQDTVLATNAGWGGDPQITAASNSVFAFPLTNAASADSVVLLTLAPGAYTAVASSVSGAAGTVLIEVYEVP